MALNASQTHRSNIVTPKKQKNAVKTGSTNTLDILVLIDTAIAKKLIR